MENKQYDNTNTGIIFLTPKPTQAGGEKYTGSINVNGVEMWLTGIKAMTKAGEVMRLYIKAKE